MQPLDEVLGISRQKAELIANTRHFVTGRPANHALLTGSRGTGKSALVKASVVVTSFAEPSERTSSDASSPLAGWPVWPDTCRCPPAELKSPRAPPVGATESASHLPTEWMCSPWKPGDRMPPATVSTVTVA